jgi:Fe2+ or Zn2+ uptake regulation protein
MDAVKELDAHPTAEQVFEHVTKTHPTISKATVYRNMSQMALGGELLYVGTIHGSARYDHNLHEHHHFICDKCKQVFDIEGDFSHLYDHIENADKFHIRNHYLYFSGLCNECKSDCDNYHCIN